MVNSTVEERNATFVNERLLPALREVLPESTGNVRVSVGVKARFDQPELTQETVSSSQIFVKIRSRHATRHIVFIVFIEPRGHFIFTEVTGSRDADMYEPRYQFFPLS